MEIKSPPLFHRANKKSDCRVSPRQSDRILLNCDIYYLIQTFYFEIGNGASEEINPLSTSSSQNSFGISR